jgi:hypothetical protein
MTHVAAFCPSDSSEPLPHWAVRLASGYPEVGAALPTRDGRVIGNATVLQIRDNTDLGTVVRIRTDAGNEALLTEEELRALFYEPKWVKPLKWIKPFK